MPKGVFIKMPERNCTVCVALYIPRVNNQRFCSVPCKRKHYRTAGPESTERQYQLISGNWERYFARLCTRSFKRSALSKEDCIQLLNKQNYRCALSGVALTCVLNKGTRCKTNASIDRIIPQGPYSVDNIQLVCAALNKFRVDTPLPEFIEWCKKVAQFQGE